MPRIRKPVPSYIHHSQTGRARAAWTDITGTRHERLLPGPYDSNQSRTAFARLQLELETAPHAAGRKRGPVPLNELFLAFLVHAEQHYRRADGTNTTEFEEYKALIRLVRPIYGDMPTEDFGPLALKAIRGNMVARGWCRSLVNQRIGRLKRMFRWGVAEELVPAAVHVALTAVAGLQRGRCEAPEAAPIEPVDEATVKATLPHLTRHVRAMVEFQRLTGCRPGEVCQLRRVDLETGAEVWIFTPRQHKTAHRGRARTIPIGPKAQEVIREFFTPNLEDYLFSPARMMREFRQWQRENRKSSVQPSQLRRGKSKPKKKPGEHYTPRSYAEAVARGCEKAGVPHWHPNQLRHSFATKARKEHGLEAAQVLLGHSKADVTQVYAERNLDLAVSVAAKIG